MNPHESPNENFHENLDVAVVKLGWGRLQLLWLYWTQRYIFIKYGYPHVILLYPHFIPSLSSLDYC